jgi:LPXTG-motif cell wall-anchored protein
MLKLTKVVNASNTTGSFNFTISYTDASGNMKTESISLQHNGTTRISGIKKGSSVTVTENSTDGYTVTMKDDSTGKILSGSNSYNFKMSDNADITVYNTTSICLPETGGVGTYFYTYGGMGIMLTAVVAGYLLRLKYEKEGN